MEIFSMYKQQNGKQQNTNTMMNLTKNQKIGLAVVVLAAVGYYFYDKSQKDKAEEVKETFANANGFKKNFIN